MDVILGYINNKPFVKNIYFAIKHYETKFGAYLKNKDTFIKQISFIENNYNNLEKIIYQAIDECVNDNEYYAYNSFIKKYKLEAYFTDNSFIKYVTDKISNVIFFKNGIECIFSYKDYEANKEYYKAKYADCNMMFK